VAIDIAWSIKIGYVDSATDFTGRVMGMSISQPLGFMQPAPQKCTLTLNNYDGALTPGAGGTYSSVDWMTQAIFISATVNSTETAQVFHGIVNDFDIRDDGVRSIVTISCVDWLTIGARATYVSTVSVDSNAPFVARLAASVSAFATTQGYLALPLLGNSESRTQYGTTTPPDTGEVAAGSVTMITKRNVNDALADVLTVREMAGVPSVIWPTIIDEATIAGPIVVTEYNHQTVGDTLSRNVDPLTFPFVEKTPGAGEFPIESLDRGWHVERIVNVARITSAWTTNTAVATDSTKIGGTGVNQFLVTESSINNDTDTQRMADNLVNRFGTPRFEARNIELSTATLADLDSTLKEEVAQLLDVRTGLWNVATVEYTPTGASTPVTDVSIIFGRRIDARPGRTTIALELLPAVDYQSFVLDSDVLGVLNQNRLG